jgi:hypothetical protein
MGEIFKKGTQELDSEFPSWFAIALFAD